MMLVLSYKSAEALLRCQPEHYDVISIGRDVPRRALCNRQLVLDFDDMTIVPDRANGDRPDERAPQVKHVTQAVSFARSTDDARLMIHCLAGLSRSPAIAWCILLDRMKNPAAATHALFRMYAQAIPNPIIVRCGLEVLTGSAKDYASVRAQMLRLCRHPQKTMFL